MSDALHILPGAMIHPPGEGQRKAATGVFTAEGAFFPPCNVERDGVFELADGPPPGRPSRRLAGRFLYGGQMNHHFGHFLCESLSRLWPFGDPAFRVDGILLLPRRKGSLRGSLSFQTEMFDLLGPLPPVQLIDEPVVVDELVVPEQAFGIGRLASGTPAFRAFIHDRFARDIAPEGPERIYISRAHLSATRGGSVGEDIVLRRLKREGYTVFYPEEESLAMQIARYRAARQVVAIEGSALHLFGFVGRPHQRVAQIVRRSDGDAAGAMARQLEAFCGRPVTMIDAIRREWNIAGRDRLDSRSVVELDPPAIGEQLQAAGFVEKAGWPGVSEETLRKTLARVEQRTGLRYKPFGP